MASKTRSFRRTTTSRRHSRTARGRIWRTFAADIEQLKSLTVTDRIEGQSAAVEAIGKAIDDFAKVNSETLDLAVSNTNVKARRLLKTDYPRQINILAGLLRKWAADSGVEVESRCRRARPAEDDRRRARCAARDVSSPDAAQRDIEQGGKGRARKESSRSCRTRSRPDWRLRRTATRPARSRPERSWPSSSRCKPAS